MVFLAVRLVRKVWSLCVLALAVVTGCASILGLEDSRVQGVCDADDDCAPGYSCEEGLCREACTSDSDCPGGQCEQGVCLDEAGSPGGTGGSAGMASGGSTSGGSTSGGSTSGGSGGKGASGGNGAAAGRGASGGGGEPAMGCGDGKLDGGEACDDENTESGDGCGESCQKEDGFVCDDAMPTKCSEECGDGMLVGAELQPGRCDDANTEPGDGCDEKCRVELNYSCDREPSKCVMGCGDGEIGDGEECDDAKGNDGDGCVACQIEDGYTCDGMPSTCEDVDECDDATLCDYPLAKCVNDPGTYHCECAAGYELSGDACTNLDECASPGLNDCHQNADCTDTVGSYECSCYQAYAGDGKKCVDTRWAQWPMPATPSEYNTIFVGGDALVTDGVTQLVWQGDAEAAPMTWEDAVLYCKTLGYGGETDWRLPTRIELVTLLAYPNQTVLDSTFANQSGRQDWSISERTINTYAWAVLFDAGLVSYKLKGELLGARCVRGGPTAEVSPRYVDDVLTVSDLATGLRWTKTQRSTTEQALAAATADCAGLQIGGLSEWRLPTLPEMQTIIDETRQPAFDPPFDFTRHGPHWTTSETASGDVITADTNFGGSFVAEEAEVNYWLCVDDEP